MSESPAPFFQSLLRRSEPLEPIQPHVDASTTEWFAYYRQMVIYQQRELDRLRLIETAARRVAAARSNFIVKDQAALDALDIALEVRG